MCVCPVSTVLASSWGADEAVNASRWSLQKWLWWAETLPSCLCPSLRLLFLSSHIFILWFYSFLPSLFDVCISIIFLLTIFLLFFHFSSSHASYLSPKMYWFFLSLGYWKYELMMLCLCPGTLVNDPRALLLIGHRSAWQQTCENMHYLKKGICRLDTSILEKYNFKVFILSS